MSRVASADFLASEQYGFYIDLDENEASCGNLS